MAKYEVTQRVYAFQWLGDDETKDKPLWFTKAVDDGIIDIISNQNLIISEPSSRGNQWVNVNDYIVLGVTGHIFSVEEPQFECTYHLVEEEK